MAVFPIEIQSLNRFAVFHSTTDSLFFPTWHEDDGGELAANMFAYRYSNGRASDYSEAAQIALAYGFRHLQDAVASSIVYCNRKAS